MAEIKWSSPRLFARRTINNVGAVLTIYTAVRRFLQDNHLTAPSFREVTIISNRLYRDGRLTDKASNSQKWQALEILRRTRNGKATDLDQIAWLAEDLLNNASMLYKNTKRSI